MLFDMTQIKGTILATTSCITTKNYTVTNEPVEVLLTRISVVDNSNTNYTHRQTEVAECAYTFQNTISAMATRVIQEIDLNLMYNCPVTHQSINSSLNIFRYNVPDLNEKNI